MTATGSPERHGSATLCTASRSIPDICRELDRHAEQHPLKEPVYASPRGRCRPPLTVALAFRPEQVAGILDGRGHHAYSVSIPSSTMNKRTDSGARIRSRPSPHFSPGRLSASKSSWVSLV